MAGRERCVVHSFDADRRVWTKSQTTISMEKRHFSEGTFRLAFKAQLVLHGGSQSFVCKIAKDPKTPRSLYFNDVEAQVYAKLWADKYNAFAPPKPVTFVDCFVLELVERKGRPLAGAERFIEGDFRKNNSNVGAVCYNAAQNTAADLLELDTAQAFSHCTFALSKAQILICDIQGVSGMYTDPQIHTLNGRGFGVGNLGYTGIRAFLLRHQCNHICLLCQLPKVRASSLDEVQPAWQHVEDTNPNIHPDQMHVGGQKLAGPRVELKPRPLSADDRKEALEVQNKLQMESKQEHNWSPPKPSNPLVIVQARKRGSPVRRMFNADPDDDFINSFLADD